MRYNMVHGVGTVLTLPFFFYFMTRPLNVFNKVLWLMMRERHRRAEYLENTTKESQEEPNYAWRSDGEKHKKTHQSHLPFAPIPFLVHR